MNRADSLDPALGQALSRSFERVVVFSGAGVSADSGIPTFRSGSDGLWQAFDPQDLATPSAWRRDAALVWDWYEWRRGLVMRAAPNAGHLAVARLQQALGARARSPRTWTTCTSAPACDVMHLHGSLFAPRCLACARVSPVGPAPGEARRRPDPPRCAHCNGQVRPGVVWFASRWTARSCTRRRA